MRLIEAEPRENLRLYLGVLLLIGLSFYAFGLRPAVQGMGAAEAQFEGLRQEIVTGRARARELLGYAERVRQLKVEVMQLERRLRQGNQLLLFFQDAEQSAAWAGVALGSVNPKPSVVENDVTRQPIDVTITGPLPNVLRFVSRLEQLPYPVRVVQLDLRSPEARKGSAGASGPESGLPAGHLAATLQVEMYSLPSAAAAAGGGKPAAETTQKAGERR